MLIDSGNLGNGNKLSDFIQDLNIDTIDYFICTHPHDDHIGGAVEIFDKFSILNVYMPNIPNEYLPDTKLYNNILSAIAEEKCDVFYPTSDFSIARQDNYSIKVITPCDNSIFSDLNNYSLTLIVNCFSNTILFSGDAEKPAELDMLNSGINIDSDILKVGHHGSSNASSKEFLDAVSPQVSIISCGSNNSYGHPNRPTLERLVYSGTSIYRTDNVGTIIAKCYNGGFNIETTGDIKLY